MAGMSRVYDSSVSSWRIPDMSATVTATPLSPPASELSPVAGVLTQPAHPQGEGWNGRERKGSEETQPQTQ